ncbi:MAG: hypothetical protein JXB04_13195, partial [Kiritimatiellae bacterium]|nr:hypothetical protein [Kiritimatiellia bacterium]
YEFYRFATHPRVFPKPLAMETAHEFIGSLLDSPACLLATETELHRDVLQKSLSELPRVGGNLVHDLHAAVLMREHAVKDILTLDTDFKTFPWLRIRGL